MKILLFAMMAALLVPLAGCDDAPNAGAGNNLANNTALNGIEPTDVEALATDGLSTAGQEGLLQNDQQAPTQDGTQEQQIIELSELELALLSEPTTGSAFPVTISQLDFTDPAIDHPPLTTDTPIANNPFNNVLQRVASAKKFAVGGGTPTHAYSTRQAWNSNETLISVGDKILRAGDNKILVEQLPISSARNWSNNLPKSMFGFRFQGDVLNEFGRYNVVHDHFTLIKRFDRFQRCTLGNGEGNISNDDRFAVFTCSADTDQITMISFDIQSQSILGERAAEPDMNWAGYTQSGNYIVVANSGLTDDTRKIIRYSPDFSEAQILSNRYHHADLGIDQSGSDVIVMIGPTHLTYIRLLDKHKVTFPVTDAANPTGFGHVSCRNTRRPGWCYVSTYHQFRVAAIKLDFVGNSELLADQDGEFSFTGISEVEPWGVHRSTAAYYDATPRASASPSGRQVIFSSDWYGATEPSAHVISLQ